MVCKLSNGLTNSISASLSRTCHLLLLRTMLSSTLPTPNTAYGISKLVAEKIHEKWQNGNATHRQLTIVRPGVVFGKGENGNFTRLYWAICGHKFAYPGKKGYHQGLYLCKGIGSLHAMEGGRRGEHE